MTRTERLLEWIGRAGMLLESQIVAAGMSSALNALLRDRKAEIVAHPTVRERSGSPAAAVIPRATLENGHD